VGWPVRDYPCDWTGNPIGQGDLWRTPIDRLTHGDGQHALVRLWALCGPGDDACPVITFMLAGEANPTFGATQLHQVARERSQLRCESGAGESAVRGIDLDAETIATCLRRGQHRSPGTSERVQNGIPDKTEHAHEPGSQFKWVAEGTFIVIAEARSVNISKRISLDTSLTL
jgi:hypothetical protein